MKGKRDGRQFACYHTEFFLSFSTDGGTSETMFPFVSTVEELNEFRNEKRSVTSKFSHTYVCYEFTCIRLYPRTEKITKWRCELFDVE